ncbi:enoyl-CoA hydratase/isomerase family protein [Piscinibacter sakaiensis]|uniref:Enoyl-CoA hydratase n=1 Tax=Piscinibacter sakaiensis TaxID=1547922 RepID=A0A0K8P7E0_PISS1|nr:enoyl-CoA hydratase/isomerase family protein [Piscinibacter sakaiensis]GAP38115.1 enoyl-CoA hydratase [Piscinibacter sakaiensis]
MVATSGSGAFVRREDAGGVCTLTLNRPDKLNAIDPALFDTLAEHLRELQQDTSDLGVIVLRGAGRSFCAGVDLGGVGGVDLAGLRHQSRTLEVFGQLPQIVIAAVHGHCFTGGLELALAADWIVAAESARFGDTHGKYGLVPAWGMTQRLPRRIGAARALELMATSRRLDGREAERIGLANCCVADDQLDATVAALAAEILANARHSNAASKRLLRESDGMRLSDGLAHEQFRSPGSQPRNWLSPWRSSARG